MGVTLTASKVSPLSVKSAITHGTAVTELRDMSRADVLAMTKSEVMSMLKALASKGPGASSFKELTVKGWLKDRLTAAEKAFVFANVA